MIITLDVSINAKTSCGQSLKKKAHIVFEETDRSTFYEEYKFAHKIQLEVKEVSESARKMTAAECQIFLSHISED